MILGSKFDFCIIEGNFERRKLWHDLLNLKGFKIRILEFKEKILNLKLLEDQILNQKLLEDQILNLAV